MRLSGVRFPEAAPTTPAAPRERPRNRMSVNRLAGQDEGPAGRLGEVEVADEVAQHRLVLADAGARVWSAVGSGIDAGAAEEVVFDELDVRVVAEYLAVDVA